MYTFDLSASYNRQDFKRFLSDFLPDDYIPAEEELYFDFKHIASGINLGESESLDLSVMEFTIPNSNDPRVTLTKEVALLMRKHMFMSKALVAFYYPNSQQWRLSLITTDANLIDGKIVRSYSNPHRYSFLLGKNCKTHTPAELLFKQGKLSGETSEDTNKDLLSRFSLEVVNKNFYTNIYNLFTKLVEHDLKHPKANEENHVKENFAVRLIGRLIFCWFLKKKIRKNGTQLVPDALLSLDAIKKNNYSSYYHDVLEPLFFETLNKPKNARIEKCRQEHYENIPFLNGGLFEPHIDDCYEKGTMDSSKYINTLTIPDSWFNQLFEVFETYNFTIDENTSIDMDLSVDPEILGRIFENLLASINPEIQESARNMTGSFYTPRAIVDYMVESSLKEFLKTRVSLSEDDLEVLFDITKTVDLPEKTRETIYSALTNFKAIDPAVGSGAFPMGILQRVLLLLNEIDPDGRICALQISDCKDSITRSYAQKLKIIRDCVFGVDIQEMAVEIARLRFFLTLIVDEEADNPKPLPNLDFKFACADTLIPLPKLDLFSTGEMLTNSIGKLKELRLKFFNSNSIEKESIKKRFQQEQALILSSVWTQYEHGNDKNLGSYADKLGFWEPFRNNKNPWFDPMWMLGIEDGFDIVIGNPPYIALQANKGLLGKQYKPYNFRTFNSMGDIYCLFYEKGMNLLKEGGILTYITSNKWMRAGYGKELRNFLSENQPLYLVDLGAGVFESATVDTNILVMKKGTYTHPTKAHILRGNNKQISIGKDMWVENKFDTGSWVVLSPIEQSIKAKIERYGTPLKDWDIKINRGVLTGCNEAFIINTAKRDEILANCKTPDERKRTDEIIRPILRGRDIKRYKYEWKNLWLIGLFPAKHYDIETLPAIKKYLLNFGYDRLKQTGEKGARKKTSNKWFETQDTIAYWEDFSKPKIIWKRVGSSIRFCYTEQIFFSLDSTCFAIGKYVKFLTFVLNSPLGHFLLKDSPKTGTGDLLISVQAIEPIRIPLAATLVPSENNVNEKYEDIIQDNVYKSFHLTREEQQYINKLYGKENPID